MPDTGHANAYPLAAMRTSRTPSLTVAASLSALAFVACGHEAPPAPLAAAPTVASASVAPATPGAGNVAIDAVPPDFAAKATDGTPIQLSALKGKPVVVYFYPKDETPGCTAEACSFRDAWTALSKKGVVLIGISTDSDDSHRAFAAAHKLPFLLVSDPNGAIAGQFGVPMDQGYISRQSFVIGADGLVKKIYRTVNVTGHAAQIMADLQ